MGRRGGGEMRVDGGGDGEREGKEHPLIEHVKVYAVADCEWAGTSLFGPPR